MGWADNGQIGEVKMLALWFLLLSQNNRQGHEIWDQSSKGMSETTAGDSLSSTEQNLTYSKVASLLIGQSRWELKLKTSVWNAH